MRLHEAEAWLLGTASEPDLELRARVQSEEDAGIRHILPAPHDEMWGPDDFRGWSHDALVWRLVFLQCVIKRMGQQLEQPR